MDCPPEVLRAIPWYAEGALDEAERGRVESHAAACAACRLELDQVAGLAAAAPAGLPDADAMYARIRDRIEALERGIGVAPAPGAARRWRISTWPLAAAAGVVLALGAGIWLVQRRVESQPAAGEAAPVYAPATAAEPAPPVPALDVIFRTDTTAERITSALRAIGGEIVAGPTRLGVYRVHLGPSGDAPAAAEMLRAAGSGVATFAEPVVP